MEIKVVGSGCKNCKNLLRATEQAVSELNADATIIYVTDMADILAILMMQEEFKEILMISLSPYVRLTVICTL